MSNQKDGTRKLILKLEVYLICEVKGNLPNSKITPEVQKFLHANLKYYEDTNENSYLHLTQKGFERLLELGVTSVRLETPKDVFKTKK